MPNYWYDEGGFRVRKKALLPSGAGSKNQEILYPSKFYGLEYNEETNLLSSINNVYLNGVRIAALNEEGTTAYFLTDQVDSVAHFLDEGAHTLSRMQYEPYGETLVQRGSLDFAPKYNSQELDRETNFYFYNARYYDPQIARFTSADSVIDGVRSTQGWNRFSYVAGNPIKFKDPTGHRAVDEVADTIIGLSSGISDTITLGLFHERFYTYNKNGSTYKQAFENSYQVSSALTTIASLGVGGGAAPRLVPVGGPLPMPGGAAALNPGALRVPANLNMNDANSGGSGNDSRGDKISRSKSGSFEKNKLPKSSKQDKKLTDKEINKLKKAGYDVHDVKGEKGASRRDLFKNKKGDVFIKPKSGKGPGEPMNVNINDL